MVSDLELRKYPMAFTAQVHLFLPRLWRSFDSGLWSMLPLSIVQTNDGWIRGHFLVGLGCAQSANAISYYLDAINRLDATQATDIKYIPANVLQVNRATLHIMTKILSVVPYVWVGFQPCVTTLATSYFYLILLSLAYGCILFLPHIAGKRKPVKCMESVCTYNAYRHMVFHRHVREKIGTHTRNFFFLDAA